MPTIELTDEELQGLIMVCANASGPGVSWLLTNALLTKAQQAAREPRQMSPPPDIKALDGLDHEPIAAPPAFTGKAGARR